MTEVAADDPTLLDKRTPPPHHHGRPPWHAVALLSFLMSVGAAYLPSTADLDATVAVPATFAKRLFPNYMSLEMLLAVRIVSAAFIFTITAFGLIASVTPGKMALVTVPYLPQSQLQKVEFPLSTWRSQAPFTMWVWNLLGCSFVVNAYLTAVMLLAQRAESSPVVHPYVLRAGIILFETSAPLTLLVSAVVTYAIWPQLLADGTGEDPTSFLKTFRALASHNANVSLAMAEIFVWGGLPVRVTDLSLSLLFGCTYILFAWAVRHWWIPSSGPQFLYFFLDTTLGWTTTVALVVLCLVLMASYGLCCLLQMSLSHLGGSLPAHILSWMALVALLGRVRD